MRKAIAGDGCLHLEGSKKELYGQRHKCPGLNSGAFMNKP